ncbi:MAG: HK97 family phage prohead protease [Pseudomonadales bacterium]|nr:HK97 family phage prohead protease [Pseudomonadales bacterium]MCP5191283.1 HK97 family phage prohead protease [Pseudomonadales bacterium]
MKLTGYAAVFNSLSVDLGGFRELIAPGAFTRTLADRHPIFAVHHHDMADLLGSTRSGTLKLTEDRTGLYFELTLPGSSLGRDIHELVQRGDLATMSFSFTVNGSAGEEWRDAPNGQIERVLRDVSLREISTVALPAYPSTNVAARSAVAVNPLPTSNSAVRNRMMKRVMAARLVAA